MQVPVQDQTENLGLPKEEKDDWDEETRDITKEKSKRFKELYTKVENCIGTGCSDRVSKFLAENQSCAIYWFIMFVIMLLIVTYEEP